LNLVERFSFFPFITCIIKKKLIFAID